MKSVATKQGREVSIDHLIELLHVATSGQGKVIEALSELDSFADTLGGELGHFLQRRSYLKALTFLQQLQARHDG